MNCGHDSVGHCCRVLLPSRECIKINSYVIEYANLVYYLVQWVNLVIVNLPIPLMWNFDGIDLEWYILWWGVISPDETAGMVRSEWRGVSWYRRVRVDSGDWLADSSPPSVSRRLCTIHSENYYYFHVYITASIYSITYVLLNLNM